MANFQTAQTTSELEEIVHQHESLVHKLQTECKRLAGQLENQTSKYKLVYFTFFFLID